MAFIIVALTYKRKTSGWFSQFVFLAEACLWCGIIAASLVAVYP